METIDECRTLECQQRRVKPVARFRTHAKSAIRRATRLSETAP